MERSSAVDGFSLAFERVGSGSPVVLLHGWPGDHRDWREVISLSRERGSFDVIAPDLRGFGHSDKHPGDPAEAYSLAAQVESVCALIAELEFDRPVIAGYDIGSRIAQEIARTDPDSVRALIIAPPLPGAGSRILKDTVIGEFWYQFFHQLPLAEKLIDGDAKAVRTYLEHFWEHWSGPSYEPDADELERLTARYAEPGAFISSIGWYRAGSGFIARTLAEETPPPADRITVPTTVLWPADDPLFPLDWSDRINDFFTDAELRAIPGGHFVPLEAPREFAVAIEQAWASEPKTI